MTRETTKEAGRVESGAVRPSFAHAGVSIKRHGPAQGCGHRRAEYAAKGTHATCRGCLARESGKLPCLTCARFRAGILVASRIGYYRSVDDAGRDTPSPTLTRGTSAGAFADHCAGNITIPVTRHRTCLQAQVLHNGPAATQAPADGKCSGVVHSGVVASQPLAAGQAQGREKQAMELGTSHQQTSHTGFEAAACNEAQQSGAEVLPAERPLFYATLVQTPQEMPTQRSSDLTQPVPTQLKSQPDNTGPPSTQHLTEQHVPGSHHDDQRSQPAGNRQASLQQSGKHCKDKRLQAGGRTITEVPYKQKLHGVRPMDDAWQARLKRNGFREPLGMFPTGVAHLAMTSKI